MCDTLVIGYIFAQCWREFESPILYKSDATSVVKFLAFLHFEMALNI